MILSGLQGALWWRRVLLTAGVSGLVWACMGLGGCAAPPNGATVAEKASYTESDEPATRKRATNRLQLAVLYFQDGKYTYALDEVKQAIAADPGWSQPYWMRGLIQMQAQNLTGAEASFQQALSIEPHQPDLQHNYGVLLCQMKRYDEGLKKFDLALNDPSYGQRAKTYLEQGHCLLAKGDKKEAEASYMKSYELDAGNPVTGYNLAKLLFERGETARALFYVRRINNSDQATADSLWLGIKVERSMGNTDAMTQLAAQLHKRFANSRQALAYDRGAFNE